MVDVDPQTVAAATAGLLSSKVIGPPLEGIGAWLRSFVPVRQANAARIIQNAESKLPNGAPPAEPRIVARALEQGSWSAEPAIHAYLGGAIAGSSSGHHRTDAGITWVELINRLPSLALALHYGIYESIHRQRGDLKLESEFWGDYGLLRTLLHVWIGTETDPNVSSGFGAMMSLLGHEGLIDAHSIGTVGGLPERVREQLGDLDDAEPGFYVMPTIAGMTLFLVGHGVDPLLPPSAFMAPNDLPAMASDVLPLPLSFKYSRLVS